MQETGTFGAFDHAYSFEDFERVFNVEHVFNGYALDEGFFGGSSQPTVHDPTESLSFDNDSHLATQATPYILSEIPDGTDIEEAHDGAKLMGLGLFKQGEQVAGVLNALDNCLPKYSTVVVEMPRRATKTTSIMALLLGRLINRSGYKVVMTAQDGTRARNKFRELLLELQRADFEGRNGGTRYGELYFSNGSERIEFDNGSRFWVVPPDPGAFRGDAADVIFIDEAGELDPIKADALLAGALPLMDTRPMGQVVIAGTPNVEHRAGLLWLTLQDLENGVKGVGGVVYAAADTDVFADMSEDEPVYDVELLKRVHPGIACGLTTVDKIMSRLGPMGINKWTTEYLCQWPKNLASSALDLEAWRSGVVELADEERPPRPERVGMAYDVDPDGSSAALVAAWRDEDGKAHLERLGQQAGTDWLPVVAKRAHEKHKTAIGYDPIGQNNEVADRMSRGQARVRLKPLGYKFMQTAAARIDKEIRKRNVVHYDQVDLTNAVESAAWRDGGRDSRLFSRKAGAYSVAPIVAASAALYMYDQLPTQKLSVRTSIAA